MGLVIESRPIREIDENNLSKWNGAFSPILYTGQRRDAIVSSVSGGNSTSINVNWQGILFTNNLPVVREFIFLSCGGYKGAFRVLSASTTVLVLSAPFVAVASSGFLNTNLSRPNYHIELELYRIVNGAYVQLATQVFRTRPDGTFSFDVSALLKRAIRFVNDYDYVTINKRDTKISSGFNFRYRERFSTGGTAFSDFDEKDVTYYVGAARQLKDEFGSNMAEYVPNPGSINVFNGKFEISGDGVSVGDLSGWTLVGANAVSSIAGCQLIFSSTDDLSVMTWTSQTLLTNGVTYEVVIDKAKLTLTTVTVIAGTNEVTFSSSQGKEKVTIVANGTALKLRFNPIEGSPSPYQAKINGIEVFLETVPNPAKFLVDDFQPTYFKDFPFDLPFIHSDNLVDFRINRNRRFLDQNGVEISQAIEPLSVSTNDFAVNRMILGTPPPGTKCIEVWLDAGVSIPIGWVDTGYYTGDGDDDYFNSGGGLGLNPTTANPQTQENQVKDNPLEPDTEEDSGEEGG